MGNGAKGSFDEHGVKSACVVKRGCKRNTVIF